MSPLLRRSGAFQLANILKAIFACIALAAAVSWAQTPITTWHYDNVRSGANTTETVLTPENVNSTNFGKQFTQPVDGIIVGHPLYLPGVAIPGRGVHNVVYVATMNDTVYAFDANSGSLSALWTTSLLDYSPPGATPVPIKVKGCGATVAWTQTGVISTPVIDPIADVIYLLAETYESSQVVHRLHALDVTTGIEVGGWPITIQASYTYNDETYTFVDTHEMNRPGLLLNNGYVYAGFGSGGCNGGDQGWVMSFNTLTAQQEAFDLEPGNRFGSVWQKGAGLSADSDGYVYADSGEGGMVGGVDLAITVFKLAPSGSSQLSLADWFTPWNWSYLSANDVDINNAVVILPDQSGPVPHEAITLGKEGTIYVLNRDNMGQLCASCNGSDTQVVQELLKVAIMGYTPVVWNGSVYITGSSKIQIYTLNNGLLRPSISSTIGHITHAVITSNGTSNGIVWFNNGNHLTALNALNLHELYNSNEAANGRDTLPPYAHFGSPIVADGEVFVGTLDSLVVYGLFPPVSAVAGNRQTGTVDMTLPVALKAKIVNPIKGSGVSGVAVTFTLGKDGGTLGSPTGVTNADGAVSTTYTLPEKIGTYSVSASASGYSSAVFTETGTASTPTALAIKSGNKQTTTVGTPLPNPLVVRVHDAYNNGVAGVSVSFTDQGAGGSFSTNPATTNSAGEVSVTYTAGKAPGTVRIIVSALSLHNVSLTQTVDAEVGD
jgi:Bacterial Ig-like domain (group 1)